MTALLLLAVLQVQPRDTTVYWIGAPITIEAPEPVTLTVHVDLAGSDSARAAAFRAGVEAARIEFARSVQAEGGGPSWQPFAFIAGGILFGWGVNRIAKAIERSDRNVDVDVDVQVPEPTAKPEEPDPHPHGTHKPGRGRGGGDE